MAESASTFIERDSICLSSSTPHEVTHCGEALFRELLLKHYPLPENNAAERLVHLKQELKAADTETFWRRLTEGVSELCGAQYVTVVKRALKNDLDAAVEMPPLGEPGSCMLAAVFYYNDGREMVGIHRDYQFHAWSCPCSHMKHDKVFLIPENMNEFITDNPNPVPFAADAYLGVPLFSEGKCFAHFSILWTKEGLANKKLSWGFIEMVMHSLEDIITERLLSGQGFAKPLSSQIPPEARKVLPLEAFGPGRSFQPFAKSLSHELRTPMQGVVGMLDMMYATVQEQIEANNPMARKIFQELRNNIEIIQDSSKRAVEAADNVVRAYDLNMQVPDTPSHDVDSPADFLPDAPLFGHKPPPRIIHGNDITPNSYKRRRSESNSWDIGNPSKIQHTESRRRDAESDIYVAHLPDATPNARSSASSSGGILDFSGTGFSWASPNLFNEPDGLHTPSLRSCNLRALIPVVIHDALRVGGRPDSAITEPIELGETIDVRTRRSNGYATQKTITWTVESDVPEILNVDEGGLSKLVSAVALNAIKFTENGKITLAATVSKNRRYVVINVVDSGSGIPKAFQSELFKPFSREDDSLTRTREGLGLGLLVAKGLARKLGGDLLLARSDVSGPTQGSDFEIRLPMESGDTISRAVTPLSRTPELTRGMSHTSPGPTSEPRQNRESPLFKYPSFGEGDVESANREIFEAISSRRASKVDSVKAAPTKPDKKLAEKYPLNFLVAEDNTINRKLLVTMLKKFGYKNIYEAFDGREAVRIMEEVTKATSGKKPIDVILMDLWMPEMDGYQATEKILSMFSKISLNNDDQVGMTARPPTILAVSADVTDEAISRATSTGMDGFMTKPYKLVDLQRLICEFCIKNEAAPAA